tara:strand:- start:410 stop:679 length:270 start_codon:yes stop_codon:yes gene_type:complete
MTNQELETEFDRNTMERITWLLQESSRYVENDPESPLYAYWVGLNLGWCIELAWKIHDADLQATTVDFIYACRQTVFGLLSDSSFGARK